MPSSPDQQEKDAAFRREALVHLSAVRRFALAFTQDEADADDLVQETFLRAYRSWEQFVPGSECRAWLFAICRNTHRRTAQREQRVLTTDHAELEALAAAAVHVSALAKGLDDMFDRMDVVPALRRALAALPDEFREVVVLVDLEEQRYDEAAQVLGIPIGTVRSRLFRARRLLQERLMEYAEDAGLLTQEGSARPQDRQAGAQ